MCQCDTIGGTRQHFSYLKLRANENINKEWRLSAEGQDGGTKFPDVFPITRIPPALFHNTRREIGT